MDSHRREQSAVQGVKQSMAMNLTPNQPQINVTPLIDVLLVLLIIFLLITPHQSKGLKALAPQPPEENTQPQQPPAPIVVQVAADRSLTLNTSPVTMGRLAEELQRIFARRPGRVLFVQGEP